MAQQTNKTALTFKIVITAGLVILAASLPLLHLGYLGEPLIGVDEAIYTTVADVLDRGGRLYVDIWDHKPPGIYLLYQLILTIHRSPEALHLTSFLIGCLNIIMLFFLTWRITGIAAALGAAWLYSVFTSTFWANSLNAEVFLVFLQLAALCLVIWSSNEQISAWRLVAMGILFGAAFCIKYVLFFPLVGLLLFLLWRSWGAGSQDKRKPRVIKILLYFSGGFLSVCLSGICYCIVSGIMPEFIRSNFGYNMSYVFHDAWSLFWDYGRFFIRDYASEQWPLLVFAVIGVAWWTIFGRRNAGKVTRCQVSLMIIWLASSILATLSPLKFLDHYFLLSIPGFCFIAALPLARISHKKPRELREKSMDTNRTTLKWKLGRWGPIILVGLILATTFPRAITEAIDQQEKTRRFSFPIENSSYDAAVVGRYLKNHTSENDTVYVYRSFIIDIYFYARRNPATRYFFWPHILREPLPAEMQINFEKDFKRHPPAYVVVGDSDIYKDRPFPFLENYIQTRCILETELRKMRIYKRVDHLEQKDSAPGEQARQD